MTSQRLRTAGSPDAPAESSAGIEQQRRHVREEADPAHEGEHDSADPEEDRVDVEVAPETGADAADHASRACAEQAARLGLGLGGSSWVVSFMRLRVPFSGGFAYWEWSLGDVTEVVRRYPWEVT